ncbi:MAG: hypothetical protein ACPGYV_10415, partial [Phycisphaeraceae bacterium]
MSTRLIQSAALLVVVVGITLAFFMTPVINQQRVDRQLTYDLEVGSNANPSYTLAAAMGSFRGIMINVAWQRSEALKQEGKFFESNNLAEWITTLQPRFPDAWDIQAWNMAYNISVKTKTAQERWDWVQKGMALLRDRGIPNNPNAVVLYRSIAWILGHKMSGGTDDMHWYYKARMAETWQTLLGVPDARWVLKPEFVDPANRPPAEELDPLVHGRWLATLRFADVVEQAETYLEKPDRTEGDYRPSNYFTTLSPEALARFYADNPGIERVIRDLEALTGPDDEDLELGLNTRTLRAFGRLQMYQDAGYPVDGPTINNPQTLGVDAMAIYRYLTTRGEGDPLLNLNPTLNLEAELQRLRERDPDVRIVDLVPLLDMMRALALIADYHMDPAFMLSCMERFGPIDWRHPAAHALYWSALGTLRAEEWTNNKGRVDLVNANRNIIHNLQKLSHEGKISFRPKVEALGQLGQESINNTPDTRMIPAYDTAWQTTVDKANAGEFGDRHDGDTYANGHENFLQAAVYLYFFEGKELKAREYFDRAKALYADSETSPAARDGHYNLNLPDFARVRMEDDLAFQDVARIIYAIRMAWSHGLAQR